MTKTPINHKDTILAVLELGSDADNLINRTGWIAQSFNYNVHLVMFEPADGALLGGFALSNEAETIRKALRLSQEEIVETYAATLRDKGIDVSTSVLQQRPLDDGIMAIAMSVKAKMIVKAIRFHSTAERGILVDTDWQLMRASPYPLWFVKSEPMPENPTIVAAVDPSNAHDKPAALDREIVQTANAVARTINGDVHLLHTYERLSGIGREANRTLKPIKLPIDEIDARIKAKHRKALDSLAADCGIDTDHTHQLPGRTHDILPSFARSRGAGLVVMGALARWGITRMLIGSTAERVIDHLPCDVLIVRLSEYQLWE
jgi:universal stress protein E